MKCKFCDAELEEGATVCPECGKEQLLVEEENAEAVIPVETPAAPKPKLWMLIAAGVACLALLLGMLYVILIGAGVDVKELFKKKEPPADPPLVTTSRGAYTEENADVAVEKKDVVVATINGNELTNSLLQMYYAVQVQSFVDYYGAYLEYMEFEKDEPLSYQPCYLDESMTWEEYFLEAAIDSWKRYQTLSVLAYDGDFQLDELLQKDLSEIEEMMEAGAKNQGLDSADAMMQKEYGANCTVEDYISYMSIYYAGLQFYNQKYEEYDPSMEQIEDYFETNKDALAQDGITKESGKRSNVRHILITPQGGTVDTATGKTTYSDEEWEVCRKKAQDLLDGWLATGSDATEESFAALANEHSADGGSNTTGGLYEGIIPGSNYVETFLNWSIDSQREKGDTGLVKSEYGYHIMYYSDGEEYWIYASRSGYLTEKLDDMIAQAMEKWPMEIDYDKISLAPYTIA